NGALFFLPVGFVCAGGFSAAPAAAAAMIDLSDAPSCFKFAPSSFLTLRGPLTHAIRVDVLPSYSSSSSTISTTFVGDCGGHALMPSPVNPHASSASQVRPAALPPSQPRHG